ncbi:energy-coupling factor transporter transmembrane component T [Bacillus sp. CGMCC 1.16541]|uniref:energy-coupling factor transporter transmembrane component T family protein n=1 Tax=Bacillus sp. CGMCC 1.16541 TaxID=2185143 RepID=UPI00194FEC2E|nr:energy-coupling factor transporter transmembrane component T [Bacillus sp. CGMCC 1.16541]
MQLESINPSIKAGTVVLCVLLISLFFDPITPLFFFIWTVAVTFLFANLSLKKWLLFFSPFLLVALGYVWTTLLFPNMSDVKHSTVFFEWGFLSFTYEGLHKGLGLALRVLSFAALSLLFIFTTCKTQFMLSLMQQCKMPPKLAYGILAGYRFLPLMKDELQTIQNAQRIRGVGRVRSLRGKAQQLKRYVIPLLASAIRKAERTALAMESKGFTGDKNRTFYRNLTISSTDWLFVGVMLVGIALSAFLSLQMGTLIFL